MLYKKVLMINLGYVSSLRLGPGSSLGEKLELKVRFVNQGLGLGKGGGGSAALPSFPVHCSTRFARLNSFSCLTPFLLPPPAEPSPRLEPSSDNSNFVYQSPTFSKDPFFSQLHQF